MRVHQLLPWAAVLVVAFGLTIAGCEEEGLDTRNIVEIASINDNTPLVSDVWRWIDPKDHSKGGGIPLEQIPVVFQSRPHDDALTIQPGEPFGSVRFYQVDIEYLDPDHPDGADLDGDGTVDLKNYTLPWNAVVPIGQTAPPAYIQVISFQDKATPPISCLGPLADGNCTSDAVQYAVSVRLTFHGVEETSGEDIVLSRGLYVTIAELEDNL